MALIDLCITNDFRLPPSPPSRRPGSFPLPPPPDDWYATRKELADAKSELLAKILEVEEAKGIAPVAGAVAGNVPALTAEGGISDGGVALAGLATKEELDDAVDGLASEEYVNAKVAAVDVSSQLAGYVKKTEVVPHKLFTGMAQAAERSVYLESLDISGIRLDIERNPDDGTVGPYLANGRYSEAGNFVVLRGDVNPSSVNAGSAATADTARKALSADDATNAQYAYNLKVFAGDGMAVVDAKDVVVKDDLASKADLVEGKVPVSQLPSYVSDVIEYDSKAKFPAKGEAAKIYVAKDTNLTYRWSGTAYVEISPSLALGETAETAYAGNKGKDLRSGLDNVGTALSNHFSNYNNPHHVDAEQIGAVPNPDKVVSVLSVNDGAADVTLKGNSSTTGASLVVSNSANGAAASVRVGGQTVGISLDGGDTPSLTINGAGGSLLSAAFSGSDTPVLQVGGQYPVRLKSNVNDGPSYIEFTYPTGSSLKYIRNTTVSGTMYDEVLNLVMDNIAIKQDKITDLDDIRAGAAKGATALQTAPVTSVNSKTGTVQLGAHDVDTYTTAELEERFASLTFAETDPHFEEWRNGASVQLGAGAMSSEFDGISIGNMAISTGSNSIVIGASSSVDYANSIVIGYGNLGCNSGVVIGAGHDAHTYPPYSVVLGDTESTGLSNFYIGQKLLRDLLDDYFSSKFAPAVALSSHLSASNPHNITPDLIGALDNTHITVETREDGLVRMLIKATDTAVFTGDITLNGGSDGVLHQIRNSAYAGPSSSIPRTARDEVQNIVNNATANCLPATKDADGSYGVSPKTTFTSGIDLPSVSSTEVANVDGVAAITPVNTGTRLGFVFSDGMTSSQSRLLPDGSMVLTQSVADERYAQSSDVVGTSSQLVVVDGQPTAIEHGKFYCWRPSSTAATPVSVTLEDNGLENEARLYLDYRTAASQITLPSNATVLYRDGSVKLNAFAVTNRYFVDLQWFSTTQREGEWESKFIVVVNAYKVSTAE